MDGVGDVVGRKGTGSERSCRGDGRSGGARRYDAAMRLTAWEEERLLIFTAAELARRHRDRGLLLNAPEAIALMCDAMLEAARGDASYAEVEAAGYGAVQANEVLPGVAALVGDVRLEVLMGDGARLVVLREPLGPAGDDASGAIRQARLPTGTTPASASRSRSATPRAASSGCRATIRSSASIDGSSSIG